ncbi:IclR family transcriptional regulator [Flavimaricola marinus]|uniref:Pca regulon regulatory protein n=1 Tax=Flavimaricola marinus TaxID=1819565 RepID=A0A238LCH8_9RHOB|nr:IclR family transcriptional regulator [Flavimaricola marinus]SMY07321.1 Pca regulon regulatory protein [Flavimaricola marinus]
MSEPDGGTVGKAMTVLDQVANFGRPVRFSELLKDSDFPKATLFRLVQTLTQQRLLTYDNQAQTYLPGLRLVQLAHAAWAQSSLATVAAPYLDELAHKFGEAVHLAQLENGQVLFIDKRQSVYRFDTLAQTGQVAPAYCTGVGKAILAFMAPMERDHALRQQAFVGYTPTTHGAPDSLLQELDAIRASGVAYDREEHERGIISIAAPIMSDDTNVLGAVSIATSTSRHTIESLDRFEAVLRSTAAQIGSAARVWRAPMPANPSYGNSGGENS